MFFPLKGSTFYVTVFGNRIEKRVQIPSIIDIIMILMHLRLYITHSFMYILKYTELYVNILLDWLKIF